MPIKREDLLEVRQRKYLAKDFQSLRAQLLEYARRYYPDKIKDFSEASVGGLFLDFAAMVGDNLSFYLDHQFDELDIETAVENNNIERLLRQSGVDIIGAAASIVDLTFYVQIPAKSSDNTTYPDPAAFPLIVSNSVFSSNNGIDFTLIEDVDFSEKRSDGTYVAEIKIYQRDALGNPTSYVMAKDGRCISGKTTTETFEIGDTFVPFRQITLSNSDVTEIISVSDSLGNDYYKVTALTNDVVYKNAINTAYDNDIVQSSLKVIPAPYRFTAKTDYASRKTILTFGGGTANTLEDDIIPDPTEFAIELPYSKTFSRVTINPEKLLSTKTLGVAATNTTLTMTYRYGGGLNHNVNANTIQTIKSLRVVFPNSPSASVASAVRGSIDISNKLPASGGEDAPTLDDLKLLIPSARASQDRVVSREDLLARIYTMPSNFGRVFRAAVSSNPNNPLSTQLHIISRTNDNKLTQSPDSLKKNIVKYLNPYRMITDAIDILDARIINLKISFSVVVDPTLNSTIVLQNILKSLQNYFNVKNFHINQPINTSEVVNKIYAINGVVTVYDIQFMNINGTIDNRVYSDNTYNVGGNSKHGIVFPPNGGIFEVKYPDYDIIGKIAT